MDNYECRAKWDAEIHMHEKVVIFSLALTAVKMTVWVACKNHPILGKFDIILGCIKIFLAILLWTILYPKCPDNCYCGEYFSIYPFIALFLGCLWIYQGCIDQKTQQIREAAEIVSVVEQEVVVFGESETEMTKKKSPENESSSNSNDVV